MENNNQPKNVILILSPFDALNILASLEVIQEQKGISKALNATIDEYIKQINTQVTNDQVEDAEAEFALRNLLGTYK
jgi:hypothetical protein